jgi:hypothetical protein
MPNCMLCSVELTETNWWSSYSVRKNYVCKSCDLERKNKKAIEQKLKAIEYLGGKCNKCGGEFPHYVYDFHHRDPTEKEKKTSQLRYGSWEKFKLELDKCDLLCANCHRIEHHGNDTGELNDE